MADTVGSLKITRPFVIHVIKKKRKVLRYNVQFKSCLYQLSVSHESNKKAKKERNKAKKSISCEILPRRERL